MSLREGLGQRNGQARLHELFTACLLQRNRTILAPQPVFRLRVEPLQLDHLSAFRIVRPEYVNRALLADGVEVFDAIPELVVRPGQNVIQVGRPHQRPDFRLVGVHGLLDLKFLRVAPLGAAVSAVGRIGMPIRGAERCGTELVNGTGGLPIAPGTGKRRDLHRMQRIRGIPERTPRINGAVHVLVLNSDGALHDPKILDAAAAGTVLVGEIRHVRVQPVDDLVEAFRLPVADVLGIVRAAAGPCGPGLQNIPVGPVGAVEIDLEFLEEILGVILPMLHAIRRRHGGIAVPVEPETHPVLVRIVARRKHALGPSRGMSDRRVRFDDWCRLPTS